MSLYLKYRPQSFSTLVGQEHAKKTIQSALKSGNLSHAYLFCGPRGTGKTSLARILAKGLNCLSPIDESEPCNQCDICLVINAGRLVDLIEIDAASNRGIDEIRELREKIVFSPSQARTKVYIIDEVHMLTKEAFNALLKTLEEPPSHAYFVLATTESHKIPETIVSRCQQFSLSRLSTNEIAQRLEEIVSFESAEADKSALDLIAHLSNGGLRDAIGLLEQMMANGKVTSESVSKQLGLVGLDHLEKFFSYLVDRKALKAIELLNQIKSQGKSIPQFLREVIAYMRQQLLINLGKPIETASIIGFIEIFMEAKKQLDFSPLPELPVEIAIVKSCHFQQGDNDEHPQKEMAAETQLNSVKKSSDEGLTLRAHEPISEAPDLNLDYIRKDWQRVLESIETPFIRLSLMDGDLSQYSDDTLTVQFKSATMMEKVEKMANQELVQEAFEKVYGKKIRLNLELKKIELSAHKPKANVDEPIGPHSVEMAAEVFGIK